MPQVTKTVTLKNKYGFHVRPSTSFVKLSSEYSSSVQVSLGGGVGVDGRNIMMLMTLGASCGQEITITTDGEDCEEMLQALVGLVENSFGGIE